MTILSTIFLLGKRQASGDLEQGRLVARERQAGGAFEGSFLSRFLARPAAPELRRLIVARDDQLPRGAGITGPLSFFRNLNHPQQNPPHLEDNQVPRARAGAAGIGIRVRGLMDLGFRRPPKPLLPTTQSQGRGRLTSLWGRLTKGHYKEQAAQSKIEQFDQEMLASLARVRAILLDCDQCTDSLKTSLTIGSSVLAIFIIAKVALPSYSIYLMTLALLAYEFVVVFSFFQFKQRISNNEVSLCFEKSLLISMKNNLQLLSNKVSQTHLIERISSLTTTIDKIRFPKSPFLTRGTGRALAFSAFVYALVVPALYFSSAHLFHT